MHDWNVVISVHEGGYNQARRLLTQYGEVAKSEYFNILLMRASEPRLLLDTLLQEAEREPAAILPLARVMPLSRAFTFQTVTEFDHKARRELCAWLPELGGRSFHLRMHRRGFRGKLSSMDEERMLDTFLLEELESAGTAGKIAFDDPDAIIALETVGPRAGLSLWSREELMRYPLLHLD